MSRKALGRGLSALLQEVETKPTGVEEIELDLIDPNPLQPRREFPKAALDELAASIRSSGVVHFALQSDASVDLDVFDMQGRRVKRLLEHSPQAAGEHEIPVDTSGWPAGFYFYRLGGGSDRATKKVVVLP